MSRAVQWLASPSQMEMSVSPRAQHQTFSSLAPLAHRPAALASTQMSAASTSAKLAAAQSSGGRTQVPLT